MRLNRHRVEDIPVVSMLATLVSMVARLAHLALARAALCCFLHYTKARV